MYNFYLDIDECTQNKHNCHNNASCINTYESFQCKCNSGLNGTGVECEGKGL